MGKKSGSEISENARRVIEDALCDLSWSANALVAIHYSWAPLPRPREFEFCQGVCWPKIDDGTADFSAVCVTSTFSGITMRTERSITMRTACNVNEICNISLFIIDRCKTPHEIVAALHNIRAAATWCEARIAGLLRHAQEVSHQGGLE